MVVTIAIIFFIVMTVLLINWRWGVYLIILAGFIQDPVRKIMPDQPVYFSVIVIIVFAICLGLSFAINNSWRIRFITLDNQKLEFCLILYLGYILFSSIFSYFSYGNILVALLGISIYFSPIFSAVYANMVFDRYRQITNFVSFYLVCIFVTILTIWMSVFGYDYKIFEEIGGGIDIYEYTIRNYLEVHAGVLRTSELAAWHLATGACLSLILAVQSGKWLPKVIFTALTVLCLLTGIFTGRRKMYALFAIFCLTLLLIVVYEAKGKQKNFVLLSICLFSIIVVSLYVTFQQQILVLSFASNYLSRAFTIMGDSFDRLMLTFSAFEYTVNRMSVIGAGIGSTGQGLAGYHQIASNWNAETGLGRLGNELGFIGFIILVATAVVVLGHIVNTNRMIQQHDQRLSFFQRALVAYLFANAINYFNAAQAYNDLFVLTILGLTLGCILNLPKVFYFSLSSRRLN